MLTAQQLAALVWPNTHKYKKRKVKQVQPGVNLRAHLLRRHLAGPEIESCWVCNGKSHRRATLIWGHVVSGHRTPCNISRKSTKLIESEKYMLQNLSLLSLYGMNTILGNLSKADVSVFGKLSKQKVIKNHPSHQINNLTSLRIMTTRNIFHL